MTICLPEISYFESFPSKACIDSFDGQLNMFTDMSPLIFGKEPVACQNMDANTCYKYIFEQCPKLWLFAV